jgi:activator of the mannose operon (transcriptional antiterminator)
LCANKDYEAVNQIAERLDISRRTVFNDLKIVEQFLITNQIPLLKKQGKGIKVTINYKDTRRIQELIDYEATSFEITEVESRFFENIETLLKRKKVTYESLAATYYISNSSVAQLFEKIKLFFSDKAGCTFYSGSQGSYVAGSESQLQFSYTKLIFERSKI